MKKRAKKLTKRKAIRRRKNPTDTEKAYLWINKLILDSDDDTFEPRQLSIDGSAIVDKFNNYYVIKITKL